MNKRNYYKETGITLIALVVTIIVLLILAGVTINLAMGSNGVIQKSKAAKEQTEIGQEKEIIALAYNSALSKKVSNEGLIEVTAGDLNTELTNQGATADGSDPIIVTFTDSQRQYKINTSGVIEPVKTLEPELDCQWKIVSDNDNNGVISIGDELAPLIDSIKNEHFYVVSNNGNDVNLITKLSVDYVTNSQNSSAPGVTYDMAYCDKEGVEQDFIMPEDMIKIPASTEMVEMSTDDGESVFSEVEIPAVYYDGTETGKVHCTGTYIKNYGLRLKQAGLNLMDFNSNSGCSYIGLPRWDCPLLGFWDTTDWTFYSPFAEILGDRFFWIDNSYSLNGAVPFYTDGLVPYYSNNDGINGDNYFNSNITLRPIIQVDIDSINMSNN